MKSEIDKRKSSDLTDQADPADLFEAYGDAATTRSIEGELLKFVQGDFLAGQDKRVIPLGTRLVVKMDTLCIGWQRWENNQRTETRMGLVCEGFVPPKRAELGNLDPAYWERDEDTGESRDPYQFANQVVMANPENDEEVFTFATSSKGGIGAIGELSKSYGKRIRQRPGEDPVIELDGGSYQHPIKSRGRIKFPIFKVVDWTAKDGDSDEPAPEPPKSPPKEIAGAAAKPAAKKSVSAQARF
jgi:hypothetical protein